MSTQQPANFLNPSHRIPPENLAYIFHYACQQGGRIETELVDWIEAVVTLTSVCRYWRVTLLSDPKFWTSVNLTRPPMTAALLERSGTMPIIAAFITPNPTTPVPSTEVLLPHFSRIRRVHIDASFKQLMELLPNLCGHSPVLDSVELRRRVGHADRRGEGVDDFERWREVFELPPMLRDAPGLKFLRASGLPLSDCFLGLHHLTHLDMTCTFARSHDYLAMMSANPMLEVVILHHSNGMWGALYDPVTILVSLPHLRRMEIDHMPSGQILRGLAFPPGTHLSYISLGECVVPRLHHLPNVSTVAKLQFTFSGWLRGISRQISGFGPNGTFRLRDNLYQLDLKIHDMPLGSLEELSISFSDTEAASRFALCFVDAHGYPLESIFSSFGLLRLLILQRVDGCEIILRLLCDPHICPQLNTVVLANVQSHATYWSSLVEMARVRDRHPSSSNIHRVDIGCRAEEPPGPEQLAELGAHVVLVGTKPWDCEVAELDWLNDSRFRDLGRI